MRNFIKGRVNRMSYFIGQLIWFGLMVGAVIVVSVLFALYQLTLSFIGISPQSNTVPVVSESEYSEVPDYDVAGQANVPAESTQKFGFQSVEQAFHSLVNLFFFLVLMAILILPLVGLLSLEVRRFHDIGQSGWMALLNLIPFVGVVVWLVLFFIPSEATKNRWGDKPKEEIAPFKILIGLGR